MSLELVRVSGGRAKVEQQNQVVLKKAPWALTQEAFSKFLHCLDADIGRAAEIYETIRGKLINFFTWRGCQFPEDHADEAINRVIRKLDEGETIREPSTYVYGAGRLSQSHESRGREATPPSPPNGGGGDPFRPPPPWGGGGGGFFFGEGERG